ncbi:MAG: hypothetical protein DI596_10885, partial [Azospira oryzae]
IVSVAAKGIAIMRVPAPLRMLADMRMTVIVRDPQGMGAVMLRFAQRDRFSRCRIRQNDCLCV